MKKRLATLLSALLLLATATAGSASSSHWAAVTDFGGDRNRQHYSPEPWGFPLCGAWAVDLGQSMSQPLSVGDRIYHLAGNSLWALRRLQDLAPELSNDEALEQLVIWRRRDLQAKPSSSHPTYVDQTVVFPDGHTYRGVIYAGTGPVRNPDGSLGSPSIVAVAAEDGALLGRMSLPAEIVSAPLVFPGDRVVFGTTDGRVWRVTGLASAAFSSPIDDKVTLGGRVSSSPVPLGADAFVIGTDGAPEGGRIMAYNLDLEPLWQRPDGSPDYVYSPFGVPASFARVDDRQIYYSDKRGLVYALDGHLGEYTWIGNIPGEMVFLNNSPAVDPHHVYYTVRNSSDANGLGQLVAFSRAGLGSFSPPVWTANLPGRGNTAPLVWGPAGIVMVGDTSGRITGWSTATGEPVEFATDAACRDAGHLRTFYQFLAGGTGREVLKSEIALTDSPYRSSIGWGQASGAGTELTLVNGMLLAGANGATQDVLMAFRHGGQVNLRLSGQLHTIGGNAPLDPGEQLRVTIDIDHMGGDDRQQVIMHGWANGPPQFEFFEIAANGDRRITLQTPPVPAGDTETQYMAIVNPLYYELYQWGRITSLPQLPDAWKSVIYGQAPAPPGMKEGMDRLDAAGDTIIYELMPGDNVWVQDVQVRYPVNLIMDDLRAPSVIPAADPPLHPDYPVTAEIWNTSTRTVTTTIRFEVESNSVPPGFFIDLKVTLPPGRSTHRVTIPGSTAGDTILVYAEVNPHREVPESRYADNGATVLTRVGLDVIIDPDDYGKVDDILLR